MSDQFNNRKEAVNKVLAQVNVTKIDFTAKSIPLRQVLEEINPQGQKVKMKDLVGRHITVHQISPFVSAEYGPAAHVIFTTDEGELLNMIVGQAIVLPKFIMAIDRLPFDCTVTQREGGVNGFYYDVE